VVIADDLSATRKLVRAMLELDDHLEVVEEASDGIEAIASVISVDPDVLVLDLSMPNMDGLEVLVHLQKVGARARVVVLSSHARDRMAPLVRNLGAAGYIEKGVAPDVLCRAVREACEPPEDGEAAA
jgi:DNA-binding NarL/FixJ family response regulator